MFFICYAGKTPNCATGNAFQLGILKHLRPQTVTDLDNLNYIADQNFICLENCI